MSFENMHKLGVDITHLSLKIYFHYVNFVNFELYFAQTRTFKFEHMYVSFRFFLNEKKTGVQHFISAL